MSRSTFPGSGASAGHWLGENNATWGDMKASIAGERVMRTVMVGWAVAEPRWA